MAASFAAMLLVAMVIQAGPQSDCLACHGEPGAQSAAGKSLYVDSGGFENSVHGSLGCEGCHSAASEFPHPEKMPAPDCGACHSDQAQQLSESAHRGLGLAACQGCHGPPHEIKPVADPASPVYHLNLPRTCGTCHGDGELAKRFNIPPANVYQLYRDSIHGRAVAESGLLVAANCSNCHGSHKILPKRDPASLVYRTNIPTTCGACHAGILPIYSASVHGAALAAGNPKAPVCSDCHTAHEITRVETESWKLDIIRECGSCHTESLRTYRDTFHGQVTALGFTRVARCSDCHGSHQIQAVSSPQSMVSAANRVATCRKCHPQATAKFAEYDPHADPKDAKKNPALYYSARFMSFLMMGVFLFFGVHTGLWLLRSLGEKPGTEQPPPKNSEPEPDTGKAEKKGWGA